MRISAFVALLVVAASLLVIPAALHPFGTPQNLEMDRYFLEHSQEESAANNVVTAILFDYRGFDTLGEATVLFTAVIGVALVLRKLREDDEEGGAHV